MTDNIIIDGDRFGFHSFDSIDEANEFFAGYGFDAGLRVDGHRVLDATGAVVGESFEAFHQKVDEEPEPFDWDNVVFESICAYCNTRARDHKHVCCHDCGRTHLPEAEAVRVDYYKFGEFDDSTSSCVSCWNARYSKTYECEGGGPFGIEVCHGTVVKVERAGEKIVGYN